MWLEEMFLGADRLSYSLVLFILDVVEAAEGGRHGVGLVEGGGGLVEGGGGSSTMVVWWRPTKGSGAETSSPFSFLLQKRFSLFESVNDLTFVTSPQLSNSCLPKSEPTGS
jgi:hypothetical protein